MEKPRKLTKAEVRANVEKYAAARRIQEEKFEAHKAANPGRSFYSWPSFEGPQSLRFLPCSIPEQFTILKSGKTYRPYGGGASIPFVGRDGHEYICAIQVRSGRDYGPIRNINVDNTDLVD